ncbi:hypothetical protein OF83DRAFT_1156278 [Amylostereum chailletii]|nr:hypothetical protein OF83DRAFT_1156278 [Amylostereum chailletii]
MAAVSQPPRPLKNQLTKQTSYVYTPPSHRLLFRGSLSVSGSRILLEGLTFTVPLRAADKGQSTINLLDNPLALALESMRGLTLSLSGTARLDSVYLDKSGEVSMDIHPAATLSRLYFENQLCSSPVTAADGTTDLGVRITLGDPDSEESSEILVYGQLPPSDITTESVPSSSKFPISDPPVLRLRAARILPAPPPTPVRLPRPDDPSPRIPPLVSFGKKRRSHSDEDVFSEPVSKKHKDVGGRARGKSSSIVAEDPMVKMARDVMKNMPRGSQDSAMGRSQSLSRSASLSRSQSVKDDDVFKVPSLPMSMTQVEGPNDEKDGVPDIVKELEKANKTMIKRAASDCLATYGIHKNSNDFKDVWTFVYRGTEFALRSQMQSRAIDVRTADKWVKTHAEMYVKGRIPASPDSGTA